MSSFYKVGLQNVGSYQVAGIPFACHHGSSTAGEVVYFNFPNVSKSIYMHFDDNSSGHSVDYAFCGQPRRAIDFSGTSEYLEATFPATDQLTASVWLKIGGDISSKLFLEIGGGNIIRVASDGSGNIRFRVNATNPTPNLNFSSFEWINLTIVIDGTSNKLYVNGEEYLSNSDDAGSGMDEIFIGGGSSAGYDGIYDELALFSAALNDDEVLELYNDGRPLKTTEHSRASNLVSSWDFEDNGYKNFYTIPDTTTTIYDRVSENNLSLAGGITPLSFVHGRLIDNALDRHSLTETGHQELTLNCKATGIFARFNNNNDELSIFASLTNIPTERMYELTGPGIDE